MPSSYKILSSTYLCNQRRRSHHLAKRWGNLPMTSLVHFQNFKNKLLLCCYEEQDYTCLLLTLPKYPVALKFQLKRTQLCLTFVHCNLEAHLQPLLVRGVLAKLSVGNRTMPVRIAPSETSYSNINELRGGSNSHVNFTQFNRPEIRHFKRLNDDDWQENYFDLLRYLVISEPDPKETWIST